MSPTPAQQLIAMANGARVSQMIHGAAELGLADQLAAGAREVEELAAAWWTPFADLEHVSAEVPEAPTRVSAWRLPHDDAADVV